MAEHQYRNRAGERLPSVTTIISRFKDSGPLLYWANKVGMEGMTLDQARKPAADAGTMAHDLVEAHIHKLAEPVLEGPRETIDKARAAYEAYLNWSRMTNLEVLYTEVPLVSEKHQYGGRLDGVGMVRAMTGEKLALCDWKSSNALYADYLYQLAAYQILWEENYGQDPNQMITGGFHLCRFAKEEGDFSHNYFPDLVHERSTFLGMRKLYDMVKKTEKRVR